MTIAFRNILVVCTGNLCRSPMAEYLFRKKLHPHEGLSISSAGTHAPDEKTLDSKTLDVLANRNLDAAQHRARSLSTELLTGSDLVLVMEADHLAFIHRMCPMARGRARMITEWLDNADVPDPYRQSVAIYEQAFQLIDLATDSWLPYLD